MQLNPFKLERYFAKYEFTARYLLCSSDCESLAVQDLLALEPDAHDRLMQHWLGYTESAGSPTLVVEGVAVIVVRKVSCWMPPVGSTTCSVTMFRKLVSVKGGNITEKSSAGHTPWASE